MDAPRLPRDFWSEAGLRFAVIYPAFVCGVCWPRALMESEDRSPITSSSWRSDNASGLIDPGVTLSRHHIIVTFAIADRPQFVNGREAVHVAANRSGT